MKLSSDDLEAIELLRRHISPTAAKNSILFAIVWSFVALLVILLAILRMDVGMVLTAALYFLLAILLVNQAIVCRRGDPGVRLLLKLAERAAEEDASEGSPDSLK